jgi:hypothetical protein
LARTFLVFWCKDGKQIGRYIRRLLQYFRNNETLEQLTPNRVKNEMTIIDFINSHFNHYLPV